MKTTYLIVFFSLFILQSFAQRSNSHKNFSKSDEIIKKYPNDRMFLDCYLDSTTILQCISSNKKFYLLISNYNQATDSLETKKIEISNEEVRRNWFACFFKIDNDIYRIVSIKKKELYSYYKEKLTDSGFELSKEPFLTGSITDGFSAIQEVCKFNNQFYFYGLEDGNDYTNITFLTVDAVNFNLISKKNYITTGKTHKVLHQALHHITTKEKIILYYRYHDEEDKQWKIDIIATDGLQYWELTYVNSIDIIKNCVIYNHNNNLFLYVFNANINNNCSASVFNLDINNSSIQKISDKTITLPINTTIAPISALMGGYSSSYDLFDIINEQNFSYVISYSTPVYGQISGDLLISKISNNNVIWNKYIAINSKGDYSNMKGEVERRGPRFFENNQNEIIIIYIDNKIRYMYHIDKTSGECIIK